MKPTNPIILALDYSDLQEAEQILSRVRPHIGMVKIGLELFVSAGRNAIDMIRSYNVPVFLDLKLHDVPTTVAKTTEMVCTMLANSFGEHFLSVHCFGGAEMCKAAMKATQGSNVSIAGVTILTSISDSDLYSMGFHNARPGDRTVSAANMVLDCLNESAVYDPVTKKRIFNGVKNFICAPNQLNLMKKHFENVTLITPGIRSEGEDTHDHDRAKPASFALKNGATWLVIGRPITKSADPVSAASYFEQQAKKYG